MKKGLQSDHDSLEFDNVSGDAIELWLVLSGAPQVILHRCSCGCRFRWPTTERRIETRLEGSVEEAVELAYCPACKSVRLRLLSNPSSNDDLGSDLDGARTAVSSHPDSHTRIRAGVEHMPPEECVTSPRRHD